MRALERTGNGTESILHQLKAKLDPVILFGAASCGEQYLQILRKNGIQVSCFADDDKEKQIAGVAGLPVIAPEQLSTMEGRIIVSSYGPQKVVRRLKELDARLLNRVFKPDFYLWEDGMDYYDYYAEHNGEIEAADALLADEKSHRVFYNLLQYKISRNPKLIDEVRDDAGLQYFDPEIIHFGKDEVFLDCGAYDGDTVEAFADRVKRIYQGIVALEPDAGNYAKLQATTGCMRNVECYPYGVGAADGMAHFSANANWTSSVADTGEVEIKIRSVDSLMVGRKVTFIKADIEGQEKQMLIGGKNTISEQAPQIAIAVYHCKEDIFRIINIIHGYRNDYIFYLRHYTEMPIDTVLYAVKN